VAAAGSDRVRVSVQLPVRLPFGVQPVVLSATAVAALEPGPPPPGPSALGPAPPAPPAPSALEPGPAPSSPSDP
jgi:hypothetical protein